MMNEDFKIKVLIADDDAFFLEAVRKVLEFDSIKSELVLSGTEAVKEIIKNPGLYDCVVLDVHMVGIEGIEAAGMIRKVNCDIPIIVMTGDNDVKTEIKARCLNISGFIAKPIMDDSLSRIIIKSTESYRSMENLNHKEPVIMVVEDDQDVLECFSVIVKDMGHKLIRVSCGIDALEKLHEINPDLILLDVNLPDICGFDVMKSIRLEENYGNIPVVFCSGSVTAKKHFDKHKPENCSFLTKPIEFETLEHEISRQLENIRSKRKTA